MCIVIELSTYNNIFEQIDWLKMFRLLFKDTGVQIRKTEKIFVKEENYLKYLVRILEHTPKRILSMLQMEFLCSFINILHLLFIVNYISWCFLRSMLSDISIDLRNLVQDFNVVFTGDVKEISR